MKENNNSVVKNDKIGLKNWIFVWVLGLAGQLCWAIENNTFATYSNTNANATVTTLMVILSALATTIATFISGTLGDRLGRRKRLIYIGFILWGIFTIAFGLADFLPKNNIVLLGFYLVAMDSIMSFFGSIGYSGGVNPWTTDISTEKNRGSIATVLSALVVIANIIILGLQGIIIEKWGYLPIFVGIGAIIIIIGIFTLIFFNDAPSLKPNITYKSFWKQVFSAFNFKKTFSNKKLLYVLLVVMIYTIGFNIYMSHATTYLYAYFPEFSGVALSKGNASIIQGVGMLLGVAGSLFFMKPINKGKTALVTFISVIISVVGLICLFFTKSIVGLYVFIFLSALGYVVNLQATTAWFKNLCPEEDRGQVEGVKQIFYVLIPMAIGSLIALTIIKAVNTQVIYDGETITTPTNHLFLASGLFTLLTLIPLYFACRKGKINEDNK